MAKKNSGYDQHNTTMLEHWKNTEIIRFNGAVHSCLKSAKWAPERFRTATVPGRQAESQVVFFCDFIVGHSWHVYSQVWHLKANQFYSLPKHLDLYPSITSTLAVKGLEVPKQHPLRSLGCQHWPGPQNVNCIFSPGTSNPFAPIIVGWKCMATRSKTCLSDIHSGCAFAHNTHHPVSVSSFLHQIHPPSPCLAKIV